MASIGVVSLEVGGNAMSGRAILAMRGRLEEEEAEAEAEEGPVSIECGHCSPTTGHGVMEVSAMAALVKVAKP